jgi:hypothetical protein
MQCSMPCAAAPGSIQPPKATNMIQPTTATAVHGTAHGPAALQMAEAQRIALQVFNWSANAAEVLMIDLGAAGTGYAGIPVAAGTVWSPPPGVVVQQAVYVRSLSGTPRFTVVSYK